MVFKDVLQLCLGINPNNFEQHKIIMFLRGIKMYNDLA